MDSLFNNVDNYFLSATNNADGDHDNNDLDKPYDNDDSYHNEFPDNNDLYSTRRHYDDIIDFYRDNGRHRACANLHNARGFNVHQLHASGNNELRGTNNNFKRSNP